VDVAHDAGQLEREDRVEDKDDAVSVDLGRVGWAWPPPAVGARAGAVVGDGMAGHGGLTRAVQTGHHSVVASR